MRKPVSLVAALALLAVAALLAVRSYTGLDMTFAGRPVSAAASWGLAGLALLLALGIMFERLGGQQQPRPEATRKPAGEAAPEAVLVDGKYLPAAYFIFASEALRPDLIKQTKAKYGRVLVGFDAGYIPDTGNIDLQAFKVARDLGCELEIYVEGPGGPTGSTGWLKDEAERVKQASKLVGIDVSQKGWRTNHWDKYGWKKYTFIQLANYKKQGFNAGEIDNISRVVEGTDNLLAFYKEYAERFATGALPQLVMKNISEEDMTAVVKAIEKNELPRMMFSDFHIFELDPGDDTWRKVDNISKRVAIRTVPSFDTYKYSAKGEFKLEEQFDAALAHGAPMP